MGRIAEKWLELKSSFSSLIPERKTTLQIQKPTSSASVPSRETITTASAAGSLYKPLRQNEIRLFRLLPGPADTPIRLEFLPQVELNGDVPAYHALSYCWGDDKITQPITIISTANNQTQKTQFNATVNLVDFLKYQRRKIQPLDHETLNGVLWVDAICINQEDIPERNQQLLLMRQVYEKATSTIVWLGVEKPQCEKGFLLIERAPKVPASGATPRGNYEYAEMLVDFNPWLENEENVALVKDCYSSFLSLLTLPWFSRIWVKQEYIVSPIITLQYGKRQLLLSDLYPVGMMLPQAPKFMGMLPEICKKSPLMFIQVLKLKASLEQIQVLDRGRRAYDPDSGSIYPLLSLLCLLRDNQATKPVDKVYALLGLPSRSSSSSSSSSSLSPPPLPSTTTTSTSTSERNASLGYDPDLLIIDYSAPVQEVYQSLAQSIILATRKLDIIRACQEGAMPGLPSWVPDWSKAWKGATSTGFLQRQILFSQPEARHYWTEGTGTELQAAGSSDAVASFSGDRGAVLRVKGVVVDAIDGLWGRFNSNPTAADAYSKHVLRWRERGVWGVYGSEEKAREAHWETLTALSVLKIKGKGTEFLVRPRGGVVAREGTLEAWEAEYEDMSLKSAFNLEFINMCAVTMSGRQTMIGKKGFLVAGPEKGPVTGDIVCVLLGCDVPVLLHKEENGFRLVGECYCHGVMKGEMLDALEVGDADLVEFELL